MSRSALRRPAPRSCTRAFFDLHVEARSDWARRWERLDRSRRSPGVAHPGVITDDPEPALGVQRRSPPVTRKYGHGRPALQGRPAGQGVARGEPVALLDVVVLAVQVGGWRRGWLSGLHQLRPRDPSAAS